MTPDQARFKAVISQRNTALDAVAEHEALITVLSQQFDETKKALEVMTKERDELKAKYEPPPVKTPAQPVEVINGPA